MEMSVVQLSKIFYIFYSIKKRERKLNHVPGRWKDTAGRTVFSSGIPEDNEPLPMEIDSLIFHRGSFRAIQERATRNSISEFNELLSLKYQGVGAGAKIYIYLACVHIYTYWCDTYMHMNTAIHIKTQHMQDTIISRLKISLPCLYSLLKKSFQIKQKLLNFNIAVLTYYLTGKQVKNC